MSRVSKTIEMRGLPREAYVEYFIALGGKPEGDEIFRGDYWEVHIAPEVKCYLGKLAVPSTKITFSVEEASYDEMLSKFRFNFLSAGG